MTDFHESLLQKVRDWVALATSLPDGRIIPDDDPGARAPLPYLTVGLSTIDIEEGTDETVYFEDDDELRAGVVADRRGTITINAFGRRGADLLALCHASLYQPMVKRFLEDRNIAIENSGGTQDVSQLVDGEREKRFVHDFDITYRFRVDQVEPEPHVETAEVEVETDADPEFSNPLEIDVEVN